MKPKIKKQQGFSLIELMVTVAIVGVISSIAIPAYQDYMIDTKWAKAVAGVRALTLTVTNCLSDNNAAFTSCDEISNEIENYGISSFSPENEDLYSISLIQNTAAIKITGKTPLADCILLIKPAFDSGAGIISWNYVMASGSALADANSCATYVKGSSTS